MTSLALTDQLPTTTPSIDLSRWPDLANYPRGLRADVQAAVVRRLLSAAAKRAGVTVVQAGESYPIGPAPVLVLERPEEFFARVGNDGLIGFGEAWQSGAWTSPDVAALLTALCRHLTTLVPRPMQRLRSAYVRRPPQEQRNEVGNTRTNISHHYDLSNDLFASFLDPTMSYSSALFTTAPFDQQTLEQAQNRKIDRILNQARVGQGTRLLEIGTGWGELAIRAAQRGAEVVSVTLSAEQQHLARSMAKAAGVSDAVRIELCDYREVEGSYDAVVSVEMIEAVGHQYWPTYFATIDRLLVPGGRAVIQAITMPHDRMLATQNTWTWINKYIFPGGFLPSVTAIDEAVTGHTSLRRVEDLAFGAHYAETLRRWRERFNAKASRVHALGFDEVFCRTWEFYLAYSEAGFEAGYLDVHQLTFAKEAE
ncbi:class I SAM-dependent methyltransferase [Nocardioides sp. Bht2]|uniref:class I SAM-dependent methyltransferase n=1 Tax=Nocardioides sp. Bht2 TaxID=3392297 RepID=UPI0039B40487